MVLESEELPVQLARTGRPTSVDSAVWETSWRETVAATPQRVTCPRGGFLGEAAPQAERGRLGEE